MTHRYPFSVIHPSDHYGQRVAAYFNLHYKIFSLKDGGKHGNVLSHAGVCTITDAVFDVNSKGRKRALREGRKNVHAHIIGSLQHLGWDLLSDTQVKSLLETGWERVTYDLNPDHPEFYLKDCAHYVPVKEAKSVILSGKTALVLVEASCYLEIMNICKVFDNNLKTQEIVALLEEVPTAKVQEFSISVIQERLANWNQVTRQAYESETRRVVALYKHIQNGGKVAPIILKKLSNDTYTVLDGWHRLSALNELGCEKVYAYVA